ncbi:MAG: D-TA family PLP-dependent enzyme [Bacteroidetes bacterium]|nr:D-TA family PLP-dependent enzyme [Bacteroidota bacterium]
MAQNPDIPWYQLSNVEEIDSPALVVFPDRVLANVRTAKSMVRSASLLRPHAKTHKSADVARLQIAEGITRFKCATIAEAEMLAQAGATDVLLAYQPVGPKVMRLRTLTQRYRQTSFACLVDDLSVAKILAESFGGESSPLRIYVDLNVGMNRTGIRPGDAALKLYIACASMKGIIAEGLHAYDGHIQDQDPEIRVRRCNEAFAPVRMMHAELTRAGVPAPLIVAGGSPTFPVHARRDGVECSPGTFVYWDKSYLDGLPDQRFVPAALVITRVVSRLGPGVLCLDLGHKSVAAEKDIHHRVSFLNAPDAEVLSQSEEHLSVRVPESSAFAIGEVLYGLPFHICPTCAQYERAVTVVNRRALGEWRMTARDRSVGV